MGRQMGSYCSLYRAGSATEVTPELPPPSDLWASNCAVASIFQPDWMDAYVSAVYSSI